MRKTFPEFYIPTQLEFEDLWARALICPDTNVLFHLFRFTAEHQSKVVAAFKFYGQRLWLPYQVGLEFQRGWRAANTDNRLVYERAKKELATQRNAVNQTLAPIRRFDLLSTSESVQYTDELFSRITAEVDEALKRLPDARETYDTVSMLFEDHIGSPPKPDELKARLLEAKRRQSEDAPPGYKDTSPGDYLIWAEMISKAKADQVPIIFVTDDAKEDWWREHQGQRVGPREELRQEFFEETGQAYFAYSSEAFLEWHAKSAGVPEAVEVAAEMKRASEFDRFIRNRAKSEAKQAEPSTSSQWVMHKDIRRRLASLSGISGVPVEGILSQAQQLAKAREEYHTAVVASREAGLPPPSTIALDRANEQFRLLNRLLDPTFSDPFQVPFPLEWLITELRTNPRLVEELRPFPKFGES